MCDDTVHRRPWLLEYVTDWFVTLEQLKLRHDDDDHCGHDVIIKWYEGYQKRKAQKVKLEKELMPFTCIHQDGGIGVFLRMRTKKQKNCGSRSSDMLSLKMC